MNPARLVDEIGRQRGKWFLYGARFSLEGEHGVEAAICLEGGGAVAEVSVSGRSQRVKRALERGGYRAKHIDGVFGRRPLRDGELAREMLLLEGIVRRPTTLDDLPRRVHRGWFRRRRARSAYRLIQRLRRTKWKMIWVGAQRMNHARASQTLVFCIVLDEPWIEVGVFLWRTRARARDMERLRSSICPLLEPLGYRADDIRSRRGRVVGVAITKRVRTFAAAKRERRALDRIVFA